MKCIYCAYFGFDDILGQVFNICNHVQKYISPAVGYEIEERQLPIPKGNRLV